MESHLKAVSSSPAPPSMESGVLFPIIVSGVACPLTFFGAGHQLWFSLFFRDYSLSLLVSLAFVDMGVLPTFSAYPVLLSLRMPRPTLFSSSQLVRFPFNVAASLFIPPVLARNFARGRGCAQSSFLPKTQHLVLSKCPFPLQFGRRPKVPPTTARGWLLRIFFFFLRWKSSPNPPFPAYALAALFFSSCPFVVPCEAFFFLWLGWLCFNHIFFSYLSMSR